MMAKSMFPSKVMLCLISVSMFLLILSSLFLLNPNESVFHIIFPNPTSATLCFRTQKLSPHLPSKTHFSNINVSNEVKGCDPNQALLKVFMYDLPPEFHFGMLHFRGMPNQTWPDVTNKLTLPDYPGGLNIQHSVEYWLTLDLLSSTFPNVPRPCTAIRVENSTNADVVFVPFFASLSYNRCGKANRWGGKACADRMWQRKLVRFLQGRREWRGQSGEDHLIVAHHPNSMMEARANLSSAIFVLADFGRYPVEVANIDKDVIAPYKHIIEAAPLGQSASFDMRPTLLYFQGVIHRKDGGAIRQQLYNLLKHEPDVHFKFGTARGKGVRNAAQGMARSKFCLSIAGDTPSSNRLFDAIASHCVPVIISDDIELPFEDRLDYTEFSIFVRATDALKKGHIVNLLRKMERDEWSQMWKKLKRVQKHFEYEYPSRRGDAVEMIWREVWHKVSSRRMEINKKNRYKGSHQQL
ncbi:hypothetical protein QQ045_023211 [Rhodiola kirilowii]